MYFQGCTHRSPGSVPQGPHPAFADGAVAGFRGLQAIVTVVEDTCRIIRLTRRIRLGSGLEDDGTIRHGRQSHFYNYIHVFCTENHY